MSARRAASAPFFLVGFMGAGKSTVAQVLASRWGWELADTDAMVARTEGRAIERIFAESGEGRFREAEWDALRSFEGRTEVVVATGGGAFLGVAQRALIRRAGISCWLDAPLSVIERRVHGIVGRPLWPEGDALARRTFFERRRAVYALADVRVDASSDDPQSVASAADAAKTKLSR